MDTLNQQGKSVGRQFNVKIDEPFVRVPMSLADLGALLVQIGTELPDLQLDQPRIDEFIEGRGRILSFRIAGTVEYVYELGIKLNEYLPS
jgi:hypothetical protein